MPIWCLHAQDNQVKRQNLENTHGQQKWPNKINNAHQAPKQMRLQIIADRRIYRRDAGRIHYVQKFGHASQRFGYVRLKN